MPLNSIQQLISSTSRLSDRPYLIVLQHSLHQRHVMASETRNAEVYRRARVRTPAENAQRDYLGSTWLQYLSREFCKSAKGLIWLQTTGAIPIDNDDNVTILNAASNPFGWDNDDDNEKETLNLENLQVLADIIQNEVKKQKRPIVVESLTPIVMRHGQSRTSIFLRQLNKCNVTLLVPILIETLTPVQHRALEDMAQAVLYLQGGEMTMIRQGVRERGNVLRETIPFQVHTNETSGAVSIEIIKHQGKDKEENVSLATSAPVGGDTDIQADEKTLAAPAARPGKVKLELEKDDAPPSKEEVNRPRIYVEDDDPEFDDMDEEDPDDDLDI